MCASEHSDGSQTWQQEKQHPTHLLDDPTIKTFEPGSRAIGAVIITTATATVKLAQQHMTVNEHPLLGHQRQAQEMVLHIGIMP